MIAAPCYFASHKYFSQLRLATAVVIIFFAYALSAQLSPTSEFRCPESYATDADREAATKAFVENFAKQHPQATLADLVAQRVRLLAAHNCQRTLANISEDQNPPKTPPQLVTPQTKALTLAGRRFARVDEYYSATTRVWSIIFVDDPQHPESYTNQLILNFYGWTPKPTPEDVALAIGEERPGTKNIFLFKAPDEPGGDIVYHIVSVTQGRANFVNIMRVASWEKSACNISFGHKLSAASGLEKTSAEARQWLLSAEGQALENAAEALRVGSGWREYLSQLK